MESMIDQFIDALTREGCAPKNRLDIIADDKRHRIACAEDKRSDKTLVYQFKIDGDFSVGWFRSFKFGTRSGQTVSFSSKMNKRLTAEEKAEYAEKMLEWRRLSAARKLKQEKTQKRLAVRLKKVIARMPKAEQHKYLERKNVKPHGARLRAKTGELVIPVYHADGLPWSLQKITANGDKWFLAGGQIRCGYYPMAEAPDDKSVIVIAEGFATAASIRQAIGTPVICAFNAGNLEPVAKSMRNKYPKSRIIIAADNDRFTATGNIGIAKAREAAVAVNGFIVYPDFPDTMQEGTDWNDYINAQGCEQLREKIRLIEDVTAKAGVGGNASVDVVSTENPPHLTPIKQPVEIVGDWRDELQYGKGNFLAKGSFTNLVLFLQHHPYFKGIYRLNDFQKEIFVAKCPPWESPDKFRVKRLDDHEITACAAQMEKFEITSDINKVVRAMAHAAEKNKFHPARDYFDGLVWDGVNRLDGWLSKYLGAFDDNTDYLAFVGKKWLTAAVKRIYEPGCKFDHVLVIEGSQGRGKSTALEYMSTFGGEPYFTDNVKIGDISRDNTIMMLQGSVIVELAELAGFNKKDDEEIKGWITLKVDRCRRPYDKVVSHFPRQFVLAATTNNYDYLKDPTGNRRYWPIKSGEMDLVGIVADRMQLWAEAVACYKDGLYIGPTDDEMELAKIAQEKRLSVDSWEDDVIAAIDKIGDFNGFKLRRLLTEMGLGLRDRDYKAERRVSAILRANGYENKTVWVDNKAEKLWVKI